MTQFTRLLVKSLFIADAHLGAPDSPAPALGHLLDRTAVSEGIYILGDLIDSHALSPEAALPPAHAEVIERLQVKAASGVPVIYIPGDRDGRLLSWLGNRGAPDCEVGYCAELDGLILQERGWYTDEGGRRHLLIHGDENEPEETHDPGLIRNVFLRLQAALGGTTDNNVDGFVERKLALAVASRADGIICGHDSRPAACVEDGVFYGNPGHWAQRQTAMIETRDGRFVHLNWGDVLRQMKSCPLREVFDGLARHLGLEMARTEVEASHYNALGPIPDRPDSTGPANLLAALRYTD